MNAIVKRGALLLQPELLHHKHHTWDVMEFLGTNDLSSVLRGTCTLAWWNHCPVSLVCWKLCDCWFDRNSVPTWEASHSDRMQLFWIYVISQCCEDRLKSICIPALPLLHDFFMFLRTVDLLCRRCNFPRALCSVCKGMLERGIRLVKWLNSQTKRSRQRDRRSSKPESRFYFMNKR